MAATLLTDTHKQWLQGHSSFKERCQWAMLFQAKYWKGHGGDGLATEADRLQWGIKRKLGGDTLDSPGLLTNDPEITYDFILQGEIAGVLKYDNAGSFTLTDELVANVIAYMDGLNPKGFVVIAESLYARKAQAHSPNFI